MWTPLVLVSSLLITACYGLSIGDPCSLPADRGTCDVEVTRYYYSTSTLKCEIFIYGGCEGNDNNYASLQECEEGCLSKEDMALCREPQNIGLCAGNIQGYFYRKSLGSCEPFFYGGCGTTNKYLATKVDCEAYCNPGGNWAIGNMMFYIGVVMGAITLVVLIVICIFCMTSQRNRLSSRRRKNISVMYHRPI